MSDEMKKNKEKNKLLIAEVKRQQSIFGLTYKDLEQRIGISKSTIGAFMCGARDGNDVRKALSDFVETLERRKK